MTGKATNRPVARRSGARMGEVLSGTTGSAVAGDTRNRAVLALDPGTTESGWAMYDGDRVIASGVADNHDVLDLLVSSPDADELAVEMIASYGMPVGREVFETCVWIGRFCERWGGGFRLVYRQDVKLHLCGTPRAKDANIRQALIDKLGPQGTKSNPGPTYGVKSHAWAALAVAVTAMETEESPC